MAEDKEVPEKKTRNSPNKKIIQLEERIDSLEKSMARLDKDNYIETQVRHVEEDGSWTSTTKYKCKTTGRVIDTM